MSERYPEFIQGTTVVFRKTFYSDAERTTAVDPSAVVFKLETPTGTIETPSVTNEPGTGVFSVSYVMDEYGLWDWRWETTNPTIADQGTISVKESNI